VRYNADRIEEHIKCLDYLKCQQCEKASVCVARLPQSYRNEPLRKL